MEREKNNISSEIPNVVKTGEENYTLENTGELESEKQISNRSIDIIAMHEKKCMSSEEDVLNSEEFEKMYITAGNCSSNYTSILFLPNF